MYVSVGSRSNVSDDAAEARRARIFEYTPDGKNERVYATGIRNPVGLAIHPVTDELWTSVNERDELGDHLVPDYITHVRDGGFYGWPWFYIGPNQDPRHAGQAPRAARQGDRPRRAAPVALRVARHDVLYRHAVSRRSIACRRSRPSTARGTARAAPATR